MCERERLLNPWALGESTSFSRCYKTGQLQEPPTVSPSALGSGPMVAMVSQAIISQVPQKHVTQHPLGRKRPDKEKDHLFLHPQWDW